MESLRRHIHILMCTGGEKDFARVLTLTLNKYLGAKYDIEVQEIPFATRLLEYAARERVDAFLIILNNIFPDAGDQFPASQNVSKAPGSLKVDHALQIAFYLKQQYHKPVLALTGWWPEDRDMAAEMKSYDGLDFLDFLPPDGESLANVLGHCLEHSQQSAS